MSHSSEQAPLPDKIVRDRLLQQGEFVLQAIKDALQDELIGTTVTIPLRKNPSEHVREELKRFLASRGFGTVQFDSDRTGNEVIVTRPFGYKPELLDIQEETKNENKHDEIPPGTD